jgi:hypothetical protein
VTHARSVTQSHTRATSELGAKGNPAMPIPFYLNFSYFAYCDLKKKIMIS